MYERFVALLGKGSTYQFLLALLVLLFLLYPVMHLGLLLDDHTFIFPSILKNYSQHFQGYLYDYGLLRPLAIIYYYGIYTLYLYSPVMAHVLPYLFQVATGIVIFALFTKRLPTAHALGLALLYIVFPLFTEQYGWLAASNATIANLALFSQLFIVYTDMSLSKKLTMLVLLQIGGILLYESVFFTSGIIALLLIRRHRIPFISGKSLGILMAIVLPSLFYVTVRNSIFPAHLASTVRELRASQLFTTTLWLTVPISDVGRLTTSLQLLFHPYNLSHFWTENATYAASLLIKNTGMAILLENLALLGIFSILMKKTTYEKTGAMISPLGLWGLFAATLFPAFLLLYPTYPFRVLALPAFFLLISILFIVRWISHKLFEVLLVASIIYSALCSFTMVTHMGQQSAHDEQMVIHIMDIIDPKIPQGQKATLALENIPPSTQSSFTYGEYAGTCANVDWCLQAMLNLRTDKITHIDINKQIGSASGTFRFMYDPVAKQLNPIE